jgi:hypothetical protein
MATQNLHALSTQGLRLLALLLQPQLVITTRHSNFIISNKVGDPTLEMTVQSDYIRTGASCRLL